jgi:fibronectin-binding autotransporter adhesin
MVKFCASFLGSVVRFALTFFTPQLICAGALLPSLSLTSPANAATLFWDANSSLAGTGTWDVAATTDWKTTNTAGAPDSTWTPNDGTVDAQFGGNPGAGTTGSGLGGANGKVTASGTINVDTLTFQSTLSAGNYSIYGGTLNFTNPTSSIVMACNTTGSSRQQIIGSVISGGNIAVVAGQGGSGINAFLTLGGDGSGVTNTFTGDLIFEGPNTATQGFSQIAINNPAALPTTATVRMRRNLSQLLFNGGGVGGAAGYTATFNNNIILNDGGSNNVTQSIGTFTTAYDVTLNGVISGNNANLVIQLGNGGGNGRITLTKQETYTGFTQLNSNTAETLRLGITDALPVGTTFIINRGLAFDMNGFSQKVAGITTTGTAAADITNTGGGPSTLTIDGNVTGTYFGNLGASSANIALVLATTNTGSLTLSKSFGNSYTGGTTIGGGKLIAAGLAAASETGTGPVTVNNGGTLGGGSGAGNASTGPIAVNSGGHIAPTNDFNNGTSQQTGSIGTFSAFGNLSLASGSKLDMDLSYPVSGGTGNSDRIAASGTVSATGGASSVGVNLGDPAGGAAGNGGSYTLMTFAAGSFSGSNTAFFTASTPTPNSLNGATVQYHLFDDSNVNQDSNPSAATHLVANVVGGSNALLWTGAGGSSWDTSAGNFNNLGTGATNVAFAGNDNVTFDDTGSNTNPITITAGGVQPNMVTINNSSTTYTISGGDIKGSSLGGSSGLFFGGTGTVTINSNYTGAGPITSNKTGGTATIAGTLTAATSLTVNGGTLVLAGANTYTGNNTVNGDPINVGTTPSTKGGVLSISADSNLGAVPGLPTANSIVLASGTSQNDGGTLLTTASFTLIANRGITASATSSVINNASGTTLTYGGVISGSGNLIQTGGGKLILSGASTYTGSTTVKATSIGGNSTLAIGSDNALPTGTQLNINGVVNGGSATFDLNGFNQTVSGIALIENAPTVTTATGVITNSAGGAAKSFTVTNSTSSWNGTISGNLNLIKNGVDSLTLPSTGTFTYTGDTKDLAGTLTIATPYLADGADVYLATGGTFALNFASAGTTDTIRSLYINGVAQATGTWGAPGSLAAHTTSLLSGIGWLSVTTTPGLPGDFNNNGKVDAGDYVIWRRNNSNAALPNDNGLTTQADRYTLWRSNFGNGSPGAGAGLNGGAQVPEPASCAMLLVGCAALLRIRTNKSGRAAV